MAEVAVAQRRVFRAARVLTPDGERAADVVVAGGRIVAVTAHGSDHGPTAGPVHELADDEVLAPGLVDTHVHVNEPGRTEWEGFASATRAAAAGGVTTVVDMPLNSIPPTVDVAALRTKQDAAAGQLSVDVGFWGGAVPGNLGELRGLHEAGVVGFKCFLLDSGVPEFPPLEAAGLHTALTEIASFDGLLIAHAEDEALLGAPPSGRSYAGFVASRPSEAEAAAVAALIDAAARTGARVHVVHVSAAETVGVLAAARADGVPVTAETCPHYLTFAAEDVPDGATQYKCCPPVRGAEHREALWDALRAGVIDLVVSDHSPCLPELKHPGTGDFGAAWGGVTSLQVSLAAVWTGARARGLGLGEVLAWMARRPAELVGLERKGRIAVGADADLVVLAPDEAFTVDAARLAHRHAVTPYDGRELWGVVRSTWLRGVKIDGVTPSGELLSR